MESVRIYAEFIYIIFSYKMKIIMITKFNAKIKLQKVIISYI